LGFRVQGLNLHGAEHPSRSLNLLGLPREWHAECIAERVGGVRRNDEGSEPLIGESDTQRAVYGFREFSCQDWGPECRAQYVFPSGLHLLVDALRLRQSRNKCLGFRGLGGVDLKLALRLRQSRIQYLG
jgi:hypothetical protein